MNLGRTAVKVIVLLLIFGLTFTAIAQTDLTVTTKSGVNLRSGPDITFESLGVVPFNITLPAVGRTADTTWVQVNYNGTVGWIVRSQLTSSGSLDPLPVGGVETTTTPPTAETEPSAPVVQPVVASGPVSATNASVINIRSAPNTNSAQLGQLATGTTIYPNGRWGGGSTMWMRFDFNGQPAWVAGWLLDITGDPNALPDVEAAQNAILQLCAGGNAPEAAPYNAGPGLHPVLVLNEAGGRHAWNGQLGGWGVGTTPGSAELVACLSEERQVEIQTCPYFGPSITRYVYQIDAQLLVAQSGTVISTTTLSGAAPRECRQQEPFNLTVLNGSRVTANQLRDWLQPFVSP